MNEPEARDDVARDVDHVDALWESLGDDAAHVGDVNTVPVREPGSEDASPARSEPGDRPDTGGIEQADASPAVEGGGAGACLLLAISGLDLSLVRRGRADVSEEAVEDYTHRLRELP